MHFDLYSSCQVIALDLRAPRFSVAKVRFPLSTFVTPAGVPALQSHSSGYLQAVGIYFLRPEVWCALREAGAVIGITTSRPGALLLGRLSGNFGLRSTAAVVRGASDFPHPSNRWSCRRNEGAHLADSAGLTRAKEDAPQDQPRKAFRTLAVVTT
jgi:hypothetical protein